MDVPRNEFSALEQTMHPQLAELVRAARTQRSAAVTVCAADVVVERSVASRLPWIGVALAAGLAALWAIRPRAEPPAPRPSESTAIARAEATDSAALRAPKPEQARATEASDSGATSLVVEGASVVSMSGATPQLRNDRLLLRAGTVRVTSGGESIALTVERDAGLPVQVLEIAAASEVVVDAKTGALTVIRGAAVWAEDDEVEREVEPEKVLPTTGSLQVAAERAMMRGDRKTAVARLRQLNRLYPRSRANRAGLLDLARLEKALGRPERAACAYGLFLARWPSAPEVGSVRSAAAALGSVQCRGLRPQRG